jgi:hypothetical protein
MISILDEKSLGDSDPQPSLADLLKAYLSADQNQAQAQAQPQKAAPLPPLPKPHSWNWNATTRGFTGPQPDRPT